MRDDAGAQHLAQALCGAAAILGVVVLAGWALRSPWMTALPVGATPMTANAAVCLVVGAVSLAALARAQHVRLARAGGVFVAGLGLLTVFEYIAKRSLGIDRLLFRQNTAAPASTPGRMAPLTAACYVVLGIALVALVQHRRALTQACAAVIFGVGFTVLVGYAYDAGSLYRIGPYSSMALPSGVAFVFLSGALVLATPNYGFIAFARRPDAGGALFRRVLPVAIVGPIAVGWSQGVITHAAHLDSHVGLAIVVMGCHVILSLAIWRAATSASQLDGRCQAVLSHLAAANEHLTAHAEHRSALLAATSGELQVLFDRAPIGLIKLDVDGSCISVNPRWCEMSGLSERQSIGAGWWQALHPDDVESVAAECGRIIAEEHDGSFTYRLLGSDGSTTWIQGSASVLRDPAETVIGYLGVATDITAYMESQLELFQVQARMGTAFSSSPIGMALVALDGTFTEVNSALCRLVGRTAEDLVGQPELSIWHPEDEGGDADALAEVLLGARSSYELDHRIFRPDAAMCWVTETVAAVIVDDEPSYLVAEYVDITARRVAEQRLAHQALHDPLTALPNRLLFMDRLEHALARARRNGSSLAVLFIDLDHFKVINDSMGHDTGDLLLRSVGERLTGTARSIDTIARLGGDEFVVLAEDVSGDAKAAELAIRLIGALEQPIHLGDQLVQVKASIGIALSAGGLDAATVVLRNADTAMYRAKERGRGRFELFDEELRVRAMHRLEVINGLRRAVDGDGPDTIIGVYQPVLDLATGRVEGAEALARWFNGSEMIAPAEFIPIAEESGLILSIGEAILLEACTKAAAWRRVGLNLDISVNVSARQVVRHDFFQVVERCLARSGLEHRYLVLELTESVLLDVIGSASDRIQELRERGVRFSIDDFGTGFSSLAYLHDLTVDQLKIDRRFTSGLGVNPQDEAIVASIITLSQRLGLDLIAEGVETEQQADHLRRLGCRRAQGFLFSRPVSDNDLVRQVVPERQHQ